jgi:hypothetical protein
MAEQGILSAITALSIKGFKSFAEEQLIEIRPLTLLAGANSSGKSSAIQPLLLLKQTLEATYDPGPILLDGPNVRFTSASQALTRIGERRSAELTISIGNINGRKLTCVFKRAGYGFELARMITRQGSGREIMLEPGLSHEELLSQSFVDRKFTAIIGELSVERERCFLTIGHAFDGLIYSDFDLLVRGVIHVPGFRGNPERAYKTTAVGKSFPGTFDNYSASVIAAWHQDSPEGLRGLNADLDFLGITSQVKARVLDGSQAELLVSRLQGKSDFVNVADVGFGVSQVIPVVVALRAAELGQLVYIEQPELHLHPRAQQKMAFILMEAVRRGVRVIVETHSSVLLLAVQALIAEGRLSPELVKLHWFQRDKRGVTQVHSTDLDENGAYGDWPEDFGEVRAEVENRYLDAVEARAFSRPPAAKRAKVKKK